MAYSYNHQNPLIDYTVVKKLKLKDVYWTTAIRLIHQQCDQICKILTLWQLLVCLFSIRKKFVPF